MKHLKRTDTVTNTRKNSKKLRFQSVNQINSTTKSSNVKNSNFNENTDIINRIFRGDQFNKKFWGCLYHLSKVVKGELPESVLITAECLMLHPVPNIKQEGEPC